MSTKGECARCGSHGKVYECERCGKSYCKHCARKSLSGSRKCPVCESHLK